MSLQSEFLAPANRAGSLSEEELQNILARARAERAKAAYELFSGLFGVLGRIFARNKTPLKARTA